jgi:hypothetical protein
MTRYLMWLEKYTYFQETGSYVYTPNFGFPSTLFITTTLSLMSPVLYKLILVIEQFHDLSLVIDLLFISINMFKATRLNQNKAW